MSKVHKEGKNLLPEIWWEAWCHTPSWQTIHQNWGACDCDLRTKTRPTRMLNHNVIVWRGKYKAKIFPFRQKVSREIFRKWCVFSLYDASPQSWAWGVLESHTARFALKLRLLPRCRHQKPWHTINLTRVITWQQPNQQPKQKIASQIMSFWVAQWWHTCFVIWCCCPSCAKKCLKPEEAEVCIPEVVR